MHQEKIFGRVVASENRGQQNLRKSRFWRFCGDFAAICSNLASGNFFWGTLSQPKIGVCVARVSRDFGGLRRFATNTHQSSARSSLKALHGAPSKLCTELCTKLCTELCTSLCQVYPLYSHLVPFLTLHTSQRTPIENNSNQYNQSINQSNQSEPLIRLTFPPIKSDTLIPPQTDTDR